MNGCLHYIRAHKGQRVIHNDRRTLHLRVKHPGGRANALGQYIGQGFVGKDVLVFRESIGTGNGRAGNAVVVLLPEHSHPRLTDGFLRIGLSTEPGCQRRGFLGSISQQFRTTVPPLEHPA